MPLRVVDTSAWIELLVDSPLMADILPLIPEPDSWLVPTIVQLELVKWLTRRLGPDAAAPVLAFTGTCVVAPLDTGVAVEAAALCQAHGLATADAIVYATARLHGADLLTCDRHFEGLPGVLLVPKPRT